eukprot:NODE_1378_length_895_cov_136.691489_g1135_i0.p1 GENE.NODE_1378_length_895_cov_136.691489_g1135_i0~~NODE_1378_length_895_cov_136.691489_g1135_i0.p1  ORF type:complete len:234 (+),score=55.90 NODE_1378_length_895_cov_136.691489_g1135_i0:26-703(+)
MGAEEMKQKLQEEHKRNLEAINEQFEAERRQQLENLEKLQSDPSEAAKVAEHIQQQAEEKKKPKKSKDKKPQEPAPANTQQPTQVGVLPAVGSRAQQPFGAKPLLGPIGPSAGPISSFVPTSAAARPITPKTQVPTGPSEDEIKKRAEYLKAQRDRLVESKKQQRDQEMQEYEAAQGKKPEDRPKTPAKETPSEQQIQMRLALARRFKEDLIQETILAAQQSDKS